MNYVEVVALIALTAFGWGLWKVYTVKPEDIIP